MKTQLITNALKSCRDEILSFIDNETTQGRVDSVQTIDLPLIYTVLTETSKDFDIGAHGASVNIIGAIRSMKHGNYKGALSHVRKALKLFTYGGTTD